MRKENLEQFMKQVADSKELQAKIGEATTEDALVALGAAHGCDFSIEDVQASAELSDAQMEGVAGGLNSIVSGGERAGNSSLRGSSYERTSSIKGEATDHAGWGHAGHAGPPSGGGAHQTPATR